MLRTILTMDSGLSEVRNQYGNVQRKKKMANPRVILLNRTSSFGMRLRFMSLKVMRREVFSPVVRPWEENWVISRWEQRYFHPIW